MTKALAAALILLAACAQGSEPSTSTSNPVTTLPRPTTTTTVRTQPFEVQDCSSPTVTFSALCEVYQKLQQWHVGRPLDPAALAEVAVRGLDAFASDRTEPRPRTLICAVPHDAFGDLCAAIAQLVNDDEAPVGAAVDAAVTAMAGLGLDPYTYYVPPDQAGGIRGNGLVGGIGVLLDATDAIGSRCARLADACPLLIVFVIEGNPGARAGLMAGDEIVAVDGRPVDGEVFTSVAASIAGDETGLVVLTIERDGETLQFEIVRERLSVPTVQVNDLLVGVGYIRIPDFEGDIPALVGEALTVLEDKAPQTLVIDLRDNPGGRIESAVGVASLFMDGGVVAKVVERDDSADLIAAVGGLATSERLIVIVNGGTASAAEILASALRDSRDAVLVGVNTFGKDAVQIPFDLRNGGELFVTTGRWLTSAGVTVAAGGLSPDHILELDAGLTVEELVSAVMGVVP